MSLEKIVRPFQTGDVLRPRYVAPSQPSKPVNPETDESVLAWSGGTEGDYITGPDPWLYEIKSDAPLWSEDKSRREIEQVRIENPDDPDQYVEVERIKKTVFLKRSTGEELRMGIDWDKDRSTIRGGG